MLYYSIQVRILSILKTVIFRTINYIIEPEVGSLDYIILN